MAEQVFCVAAQREVRFVSIRVWYGEFCEFDAGFFESFDDAVFAGFERVDTQRASFWFFNAAALICPIS